MKEKILNIKRIFLSFTTILILFINFVSCSFLAKIQCDEDFCEKGHLVFSATSPRTLTVYSFDFSNATDLVFSLMGTDPSLNSIELGTWSSYSEMQSDSSILIDTGNWTFRLSVTKEGKEVLFGKITKLIKQGENYLDFGVLSRANSTDSSSVSEGKISFTLNFPSDCVESAIGILYKFSSTDKDLSVFSETTLTIFQDESYDSVIYINDRVLSGTYILLIKLYSDSIQEESSLLYIHQEFAIVEPGLLSSGTETLDELNVPYSILYELNGGEFSSGIIKSTFSVYENVDLTSAIPIKTGYTFIGWTDDSNASTNSTIIKNWNSGERTTDVTLYAVWSANTYTISFDSNGGSGTMRDISVSYDEEVPLTANAFTKTGYTFLGWGTDPDSIEKEYSDGAVISNLTSKNGNTVILYAVWSKNSSTGAAENPYETTITFTTTPTDGGTLSRESWLCISSSEELSNWDISLYYLGIDVQNCSLYTSKDLSSVYSSETKASSIYILTDSTWDIGTYTLFVVGTYNGVGYSTEISFTLE